MFILFGFRYTLDVKVNCRERVEGIRIFENSNLLDDNYRRQLNFTIKTTTNNSLNTTKPYEFYRRGAIETT